MDELEDIFRRYDEEGLSALGARDRLMEHVFRNRDAFGLGKLDDDGFSDFIVFMADRLGIIMEKYDRRRTSFSAYFFGVMRRSFYWWKRRRVLEFERNACFRAICAEGDEEKRFMYEREEGAPALEANEAALSAGELEEMVRRNLTFGRARDGAAYRLRSPSASRFDREMCLILAVKSCYHMDCATMDKVQLFTGIDRAVLEGLVSEGREAISRKIGRVDRISRTRDSAYYFKRRLQVHEENLRDLYADTSRFSERMARLDRKWCRTLESLARASTLLSPSNVAVGRILGMSPRRVAYMVSLARTAANGGQGKTARGKG